MQERYVQFIELITALIVATKNPQQGMTSLPKKRSSKTTMKAVATKNPLQGTTSLPTASLGTNLG
jgi:hypothetical protein